MVFGKGSERAEAFLIFDTIPVINPLLPIINEASGIAESVNFPGHLWVQEDSGGPTQLYLLDKKGKTIRTVQIKDAVNRDWEDMVLSGGYIYIGEIGDNAQRSDSYRIMKIKEPASGMDSIEITETIQFVYPDGSHDAEAFLVDPNTKDIFVITKRTLPSIIYKISYPYGKNIQTATEVARLTYSGVVSAALAPDGRSILVKTYSAIQRYPRKKGQSIGEALKQPPTKVYYRMEPQGEAICFALNGSGFYTLSEKGYSNNVFLYFYPVRK
jgi:hypothetical protein